MCIYCGTNKYRKIYENHHGPIPRDSDGRNYEIHHIDGNHENNVHSNLVAVSIQEHYAIHYAQGDWAACLLITRNMKISPEEKSTLARKNALDMVKNGIHPFLGGNVQRKFNARTVANGTHHWLGPESNEKMLIENKHPSQNPKNIVAAKRREQKKVSDGTHLFLNKQWQADKCKRAVINGNHNFLGGEIQGQTSRRRVQDGTHNFLRDNNPQIQNRTHHFFGGNIQRASNLKRLLEGTHPSQKKITCEHCEKMTSVSMHKRWHGDNCKTKQHINDK